MGSLTDGDLPQEPGSQAWHEARGLSPVYHPDDLIAEARERPVDAAAVQAPPALDPKNSRRGAGKKQATTETPSAENAGAGSGEIPVDAREDAAVKS